MRTLRRSHGGKRNLVSPGSQNGPLVVRTKQTISCALHVHEVFRMCTDATQQTENALDEKWGLGELAVHKMGQRVEMRDVVALKLEPRALCTTVHQDVLNVRERVLEHARSAVFKKLFLPRVLELRVSLEHWIEPEIH